MLDEADAPVAVPLLEVLDWPPPVVDVEPALVIETAGPLQPPSPNARTSAATPDQRARGTFIQKP
ncbi:MAG: hypothetical protein H6710_24810 [Myxococcales bacterium]|nr:hypothetical protein [Myxococcales bacterium]